MHLRGSKLAGARSSSPSAQRNLCRLTRSCEEHSIRQSIGNAIEVDCWRPPECQTRRKCEMECAIEASDGMLDSMLNRSFDGALNGAPAWCLSVRFEGPPTCGPQSLLAAPQEKARASQLGLRCLAPVMTTSSD